MVLKVFLVLSLVVLFGGVLLMHFYSKEYGFTVKVPDSVFSGKKFDVLLEGRLPEFVINVSVINKNTYNIVFSSEEMLPYLRGSVSIPINLPQSVSSGKYVIFTRVKANDRLFVRKTFFDVVARPPKNNSKVSNIKTLPVIESFNESGVKVVNGVSECLEESDYCLFKSANNSWDDELCDKIVDLGLRDSCLLMFAESGDDLVCERISQGFRDECLRSAESFSGTSFIIG